MFWFNIYRSCLPCFPRRKKNGSSSFLVVSFVHIWAVRQSIIATPNRESAERNAPLSLFVCYNESALGFVIFSGTVQDLGPSRILEVSATGSRCVLCFERGNGDEMGR